MLRVMCAVESISVPSQSKTIRSNCCRAMRIRFVAQFSELVEEVPAFGRQRRVELQGLAGCRMREAQPMRMQEHPLERRPRVRSGKRLVQGEVAVFRVAGDAQPEMREMDPDLMRAT